MSTPASLPNALHLSNFCCMRLSCKRSTAATVRFLGFDSRGRHGSILTETAVCRRSVQPQGAVAPGCQHGEAHKSAAWLRAPFMPCSTRCKALHAWSTCCTCNAPARSAIEDMVPLSPFAMQITLYFFGRELALMFGPKMVSHLPAAKPHSAALHTACRTAGMPPGRALDSE